METQTYTVLCGTERGDEFCWTPEGGAIDVLGFADGTVFVECYTPIGPSFQSGHLLGTRIL